MNNRLLHFIIQDYPRKLLALLFAVMLYVGVAENVFEQRHISGVQVDVKLSSDLISPPGRTHKVTIKVQGSERALKELNPEDISAQVYVGPEHRIESDIYQVQLRPDMFKVKKSIKIIQSQPLRLQLQRRMTKRVKVRAQFSGKLSPEYRCSAVRCIPEEVMVSGPELTLSALNSIFSEPIPLSETVRDPFEFESKLVTPDGLVISPEKVMFQVDITKSFEQRRLVDLPILLVQSSDTALQAKLVAPNQKAEVVVIGLPPRLSVLDVKDIRLFADLSNIRRSGIYTVPLRFSCAVEGVSIKAVSPGEVQVNVVKLP